MVNEASNLMKKAMNCLRREVGDIEREELIVEFIRGRFDYMAWREQESFYYMNIKEINDLVRKQAESNDFLPVIRHIEKKYIDV